MVDKDIAPTLNIWNSLYSYMECFILQTMSLTEFLMPDNRTNTYLYSDIAKSESFAPNSFDLNKTSGTGNEILIFLHTHYVNVCTYLFVQILTNRVVFVQFTCAGSSSS